MRFAFITHGIFDERIGYGLGRALVDLGHHCTLIGSQEKSLLNLSGFDVVIEPQHGRTAEIPKDAVFITWVFEYYGAGDPDYSTLAADDLLYSFGNPDIIGCPRFPQWRGSLTVAVEESLLDRLPIAPSLDMSLAGFIAPLSWFFFPTLMRKEHRFNVIADITHAVVRRTAIRPLSGAFDQQQELAGFKQFLPMLIADRGWTFEPDWIEEMHSYGAKLIHNCARWVNRSYLAKLALSVTHDIEFWGLNWDAWIVTAPYAHGFRDEPEPIYNLYQRSRINLHDNIFGFSLHWRVLEAMAVGGFVMAHESPHFGKAGQMTETFVPEVHFGQYNADNFSERAQYWLSDHAARSSAIKQAKEVIRSRHLWKHRAQQILKDLA